MAFWWLLSLGRRAVGQRRTLASRVDFPSACGARKGSSLFVASRNRETEPYTIWLLDAGSHIVWTATPPGAGQLLAPPSVSATGFLYYVVSAGAGAPGRITVMDGLTGVAAGRRHGRRGHHSSGSST